MARLGTLSGLFLSLLALFLLGCSHVANKKPLENTVIKGKNDQREYRYVQLDNGLKVLLISDAKADLASASMYVGVGSGHDPLTRQGLTHFLEHMLFLGTEKYPESDGFQQFISNSGGQHNAYTALDHTNYYFTVAPKALDEALDRFAQFFTHPLFEARYVEQEKHAVHSEFQAGFKNDSRRQRGVLATLMHKEHGLAKFSVGSLVTLGGEEDGLLVDLKALFAQYYVAQNMGLSVLSSRSLDELEQEVAAKFSAIRHQEDFQAVTWQESPFSIELPAKVLIQPEKQLHELSVLFPMPALNYDGKKSHALLAHLLGDESEGSLHALLKAKGLIDSLSAGLAWNYPGGSAFAVHFGLSELGREHTEEILQHLFATIELVKQESGQLERVYQDLAQIERLSFDYQTAKQPLAAVMSAANNLAKYPASNLLLGGRYFAGFDASDFKHALSYLRLDNALFLALDKLKGEKQLSPYYQTPFRVEPVDKGLKAQLQQVKASEDVSLMASNPFIAKNLKLLPTDKAKHPQLIEKQEHGELWYRGVGEFELPRASAYYSLILPEEKLVGEQSVLLSLYLSLLKDSLNSWTYPVHLAKMDFSIYSHLRGLTIRIQGFSDQQQGLLDMLLQQMQTVEFTEQQFDRIKQRKARQWKNSEKNPPYQRLGSELSERLIKPKESLANKQQYLEKIQLKQVQDYAASLFEDAFLRVLNNGNISEKQAKKQFAMVYQLLKKKQGSQVADLSVVKIAESTELALLSEHSDALLAEYWQGGAAKDVEQQALWLLLSQSLSSAFFNDMRTEKQLGYIVLARYMAQLDVPGLVFIIQSPSASERELYHEVRLWQEAKLADLHKASETELQEWREAVLQQLMQNAKSLEEQSGHYWAQLALGDVNFDMRDRVAAALKSIDAQQWQDFISHLQPKKLLITTSKSCVSDTFCLPSEQELKSDKAFIY